MCSYANCTADAAQISLCWTNMSTDTNVIYGLVATATTAAILTALPSMAAIQLASAGWSQTSRLLASR